MILPTERSGMDEFVDRKSRRGRRGGELLFTEPVDSVKKFGGRTVLMLHGGADVPNATELYTTTWRFGSLSGTVCFSTIK